MASQAALSPHLEKPYILPGIKQKPGDIFIPNWFSDRPLAMDTTVVSPTQVHLLAYYHPQSEQLSAAHWRGEQKRKKYEQELVSLSQVLRELCTATLELCILSVGM